MPGYNYSRKRKSSKLRRKTHKSIKNRGGAKKSKKWTTAFDAADSTYRKTKSLSKARSVLKKQALVNAQRLFGNVGS